MTAPQISAVGQIAMYVADLPGAIAFYRDKVGLPFLFEAPPAMAFFRIGDARLLLGAAPPGTTVHPPSTLQFRVSDIQAAHQALAARGVEFIAEPHVVHRAPGYELWLAEFKGPEGAAHGLMEERGSLGA